MIKDFCAEGLFVGGDKDLGPKSNRVQVYIEGAENKYETVYACLCQNKSGRHRV